ncbi:MAG TPA: hypothetical protein VMR25_19630 [Planctomycetaceae bacterium]|jgi:hypothetical protein|nr:hypothetical protein [Planctomycetaceae bacterium]
MRFKRKTLEAVGKCGGSPSHRYHSSAPAHYLTGKLIHGASGYSALIPAGLMHGVDRK